MVNYSNSKIYKIEPIVPHPPEDVYYGATAKQYLCQRWGIHTGDYNRKKESQTTARILFDKYGVKNCHIILVEKFPCQSKDELYVKEGTYIRDNPCVNKIIAGRTRQEYRQFYMSIPGNKERKLLCQQQRTANRTDEKKEAMRLRHNELQKIRRNKSSTK